ncbi:peptidylprolyl isomerase [Dinghuibacter silviterrae]|uniref:Periplasmic chaperone PpiD n=1 Tax=Dinghuibacter silviterrae TaxID=1539049 RepID=A0A4R8DNS3_9BACT|nr:peptidylprolyl isomerase [Dinghuibacter silviterrae]TDW99691.1 peptidyl-prolyl cis-trans isomerase D [Dinghuibacter silviterrae]
MSIIQKIRDKYAAAAIGAIAIAMVGFILIDALSQRTGGSLFGKNTTVVGKIDGQEVEYVAFENQVKSAEQRYQQQGMPVTDVLREEINNTLWQQMVEQMILQGQADKMGLTVTDNELKTLIYTNPTQELRQLGTDPKTGQYDPARLQEQVQAILRLPATDQRKQAFTDYLYNVVAKQALKTKYLYLLAGAAYYPKWLAAKDNQDNSAQANISYVNIPFALIPDTSLPVTDAEIDTYIQDHKAEFKTTEASRNLTYVVFDGDPSSKDSANALGDLMKLETGLADTKDPGAYLNQSGSAISYYDGFVAKTALQVPNKDTIMELPVGGIFGPYLDHSNYVLAKMIDKKDLPDSVRARHILIATTDPRSGQTILDDSTAKHKIDSIQTLIEHGANFDSLAVKLSDDQGSKEKGGDLGYFTANQMVPAFSDFCFNGKKGEKKVVKSEYGYHLIEILDQKNIEPHYKVAYLAKEIVPSDETTNAANAAATSFAADAQAASGSAFDDIARKHKVVTRAGTVKETDYQVQGLGSARQLVKWAFDNKVGTVSDPESYGNNFVVAVLTGIQDAGLPSGSYARTLVENSVRRDKKAAQIIAKLGTVTDLNSAAAKYAVTVQNQDSLGFGSTFVPNLGNEPKVIGSAFNKANLNKASAPFKGNTGVFVVQTNGVISVPNQNNDYTLLRTNMEGMMRNAVGYNALEGLHEAANIKDNRIKFY